MCAIAAGLAARRQLAYRVPTPTERDDIAEPVARILVRHLPMDRLGPDLADLAEAAAATHGYASRAPLIERRVPADAVTFPPPEEI